MKSARFQVNVFANYCLYIFSSEYVNTDSDTNEFFDTRPDVLVYFIFLSKYNFKVNIDM